MTVKFDVAVIDLSQTVGDLLDEQQALRALVRDVDAGVLDAPTPAEGWDVGDQLCHLAHGDLLALRAATDPAAFAAEVQRLMDGDLDGNVRTAMAEFRADGRDGLLRSWQEVTHELVAALDGRSVDERITWVAGPMSLGSFVRARIMEAFAHGQDVRDALDVGGDFTDRVVHVAHLGVRTRDFSYRIRGLEPPTEPIRVELVTPSGDRRAWGDANAADRVVGPASDFALVVTRRRHPDDTALEIEGLAATEWMEVAQCYAGPPTPHRPAGTFRDGWRGAAGRAGMPTAW